MIGKKLAHYEIIGKLGQGGMGVVYEARDSHLDRHVALKVLPHEALANPERKQRFVWEAKAASALNHPNIVTVYDINSEDGIDYIAMELVRGHTLDEILSRGRPRLNDTLKYGVQIADALAIAHAAGIAHRDLKPANVMVTDRGLVKILDFGLAKLTDDTTVGQDEATRTQRGLTQEGTVVGSAPYMSPEQAEGKRTDARTDIFSFGAVLYELITGRRAFDGGSWMSTVAAVINKDPEPPSKIVPAIPREVERIVVRCLRKDLDRRSQSMAEIKIALQEIKEESESGLSAPVPVPAQRRKLWLWASAAVLLIVSVSSTAWFFARPSEPDGPMKETPLTTYAGYEGQPSFAPDGNQYAFVWDGDNEKSTRQIYVSLISRGTPLRLTNEPEGADSPSWSPDGQTIAYQRIHGNRNNELCLIPALGGPVRAIAQAMFLSKAAWSSDGKWLYVSHASGPAETERLALFAIPFEGGAERPLIAPASPPGDSEPSVSSDGRHLAFFRLAGDWDHDLYVLDVNADRAAGTPRRITDDHGAKVSAVWTPDGKGIVYIVGVNTSDRAIYQVPVSGGAPRRIQGVGQSPADLAVSPKGNRLIYTQSNTDVDFRRIDLTAPDPARTSTRFLSSTRLERSASYSPDGKRIAFSSNRGGLRQIWVADADGSNPVPVTAFENGFAGCPRWSPDGLMIAFDARPDGKANVYVVRADGGKPRRLTDTPGENHVPCWSADGKWIYFGSNRSGTHEIHRMPSSGGAAIQITRSGGLVPLASPDGKWLYYTVNRGLRRVPVDGGDATQMLKPATMFSEFPYTIAPHGIYFVGSSRGTGNALVALLKLYRFSDQKIVDLALLENVDDLYIGLSPDERWFLYGRREATTNDLMLVENFR